MKNIIWSTLTDQERRESLQRPTPIANFKPVTEIIDAVKARGDPALFEFTEKFDQIRLNQLKISTKSSMELNPAIQTAISRIENYHRAQIPEEWRLNQPGVQLWRSARPIQRVGLYVPGGSALLISTLMMLAIPAKVAGCPMRVVCIPPDKRGELNPLLLATAEACGIEAIYTIGGAQAIAAMAYGTESVPKVDKIFGPGNSWVTCAKQIVSQDPQGASIDLPAGPSELLVIADETANARFVAADLLAQAEHGPDSQVILVSTSSNILEAVQAQVLTQVKRLPREKIVLEALKYARWIQVSILQEAIAISNEYGPEHLSLQIANPESACHSIVCAGAVFVGHYTPETYGDYVTGSNHVLPTSGFARSISGLSLKDFMTTISFQSVDQNEIMRLGQAAKWIAKTEQLEGHANAITVREPQEKK